MSTCVICEHHPHEVREPHTDDCRQTHVEGSQVCDGCLTRIRTNLDDITDAYTLTDEPPWPQHGGDGRSTGHGLPGGTDRLNWRQGADLFGVLTTWVRDWCEVLGSHSHPDGEPCTGDCRPLHGPDSGELVRLCGWLYAHLPNAAKEHQAIGEFADEIRHLAGIGRRIAGLEEHAGQRIQCPAPDCGHTLRIDGGDLEAHVYCRTCGTDWTVGRLILVARWSDTGLVDAEVAAMIAQVDVSTIRRWARTGKIPRPKRGQYEVRALMEAKMSA